MPAKIRRGESTNGAGPIKASDVSMELWNSQQAGTQDGYGLYAKFNPPTVYNGRVYQPSFSKQFCVYGSK